AGGGEDGVPELGESLVGGQVGKDGCCPGGSGGGNDGPVDVVASNEFQRRSVRPGDGAVGAAYFFRVLLREQAGIAAGDGQARGSALVGSGHAIVEPAGGVVKALVVAVLVAQQRGFLVGKQGGDELGAV